MADDHATGSDHQVIEGEMVSDGLEEPDQERVVGWNLAAITQEDLNAAEKLCREVAKERAHRNAGGTEAEVQQEAAWCQEAMSSFVNATAKKLRICARSKRWWDADIKDWRKSVRKENRRHNLRATARAKAILPRSIWQSNITLWIEYLKYIRGAEVWRAA